MSRSSSTIKRLDRAIRRGNDVLRAFELDVERVLAGKIALREVARLAGDGIRRAMPGRQLVRGHGGASNLRSAQRRFAAVDWYFARCRVGSASASRRNGSPSSRVTIISRIVVLPSPCALAAARNAGPTSASLSIV